MITIQSLLTSITTHRDKHFLLVIRNFKIYSLNFKIYSFNVQYTVINYSQETLSRIFHILGYKTSLSKFKKIEIISSIFYKHNAMRLEISYKKKTAQSINKWKLINILLNI